MPGDPFNKMRPFVQDWAKKRNTGTKSIFYKVNIVQIYLFKNMRTLNYWYENWQGYCYRRKIANVKTDAAFRSWGCRENKSWNGNPNWRAKWLQTVMEFKIDWCPEIKKFNEKLFGHWLKCKLGYHRRYKKE